MPYISQRDLNRLREIARTATMENASFGFDQETVTGARTTFGTKEEMPVDDLVKARTKLWRDSWIVHPLREVIDRIEGKGSKQ